jgi:PAS domain-containing protein
LITEQSCVDIGARTPWQERIVQRWILEQNLERFEGFLAAETDEGARRTLRSMIRQAERELALLIADTCGAASGTRLASSGPHRFTEGLQKIRQFRQDIEVSPNLYLLLDPGPGLHIAEANAAYATATMVDERRVAGQRLFDVYPDNPDDDLADGASLLLRSLRIAAGTGMRHRMKVQRYDVRDRGGVFVERYWRPRNIPLLNDQGQLLYLLHHVEDVTEQVVSEREFAPETE